MAPHTQVEEPHLRQDCKLPCVAKGCSDREIANPLCGLGGRGTVLIKLLSLILGGSLQIIVAILNRMRLAMLIYQVMGPEILRGTAPALAARSASRSASLLPFICSSVTHSGLIFLVSGLSRWEGIHRTVKLISRSQIVVMSL